MNKRIKEMWLEALRSGDYKQTTGCLNNGKGGFCCLGVLTDLYIKEKNKAWIPNSNGHLVLELGRNDFLLEEVQEWAEVDTEDPRVGTRTLSEYNDGLMPFPEIADLIEKKL